MERIPVLLLSPIAEMADFDPSAPPPELVSPDWALDALGTMPLEFAQVKTDSLDASISASPLNAAQAAHRYHQQSPPYLGIICTHYVVLIEPSPLLALSLIRARWRIANVPQVQFERVGLADLRELNLEHLAQGALLAACEQGQAGDRFGQRHAGVI